jgi:hypothetical protein
MQPSVRKFTREEENGKLAASDDTAQSGVATAPWAVSTCECITELNRPQAGGYTVNVQKKSARGKPSRAL